MRKGMLRRVDMEPWQRDAMSRLDCTKQEAIDLKKYSETMPTMEELRTYVGLIEELWTIIRCAKQPYGTEEDALERLEDFIENNDIFYSLHTRHACSQDRESHEESEDAE